MTRTSLAPNLDTTVSVIELWTHNGSLTSNRGNIRDLGVTFLVIKFKFCEWQDNRQTIDTKNDCRTIGCLFGGGDNLKYIWGCVLPPQTNLHLYKTKRNGSGRVARALHRQRGYPGSKPDGTPPFCKQRCSRYRPALGGGMTFRVEKRFAWDTFQVMADPWSNVCRWVGGNTAWTYYRKHLPPKQSNLYINCLRNGFDLSKKHSRQQASYHEMNEIKHDS